MEELEGAGGASALAQKSGITRGQVAAAVIGNGLEFYDFTIFALFAKEIGATFFPTRSHFVSLILTLATFGIGFITRPVGSLVIGRFADVKGRRPAMLLSFTLMGTAILGLSLTPSYAAIGVAAPILVLLWRLAQGFALGGEVGPTTAFLVESAPAERRGFYASWQNASQNLAAAGGGVVGAVLAAAVGAAGLLAWGWRAAFLLGVLTLPLGLWLRRNLPETLHHAEPPSPHQPLEARLRDHLPIILIGLGLIIAATVGTYALTYMTTYGRETLKLGPTVSLVSQVVSGGAGAAFGLVGGVLTDRFGRRGLLIWPRLAVTLAIWPVYWLMVHNRDGTTFLIGVFVLASISALSTAASFVFIAESVRKPLRGLIFGGVYAVAVAVFGGSAQAIVTWLIEATHDPTSPAWYVTAFSALGLVASVMARETRPRPASV